MIEEEKDSVFELKDAKIVYDSITDKRHRVHNQWKKYIQRDVITTSKHIDLENVYFDAKAGLYNIHFKKTVRFTNTKINNFAWNIVDNEFKYNLDSKYFESIKDFQNSRFLRIRNSIFNHSLDIDFDGNKKEELIVFFTENTININNEKQSFRQDFLTTSLSFHHITQITFDKNKINLKERPISLTLSNLNWNIVTNNTVTGESVFDLDINKAELLIVNRNNFGKYFTFSIDDIKDNHTLDWNDFNGKSANGDFILNYIFNLQIEDKINEDEENAQENILKQFESAYNIKEHLSKRRIENEALYNLEIALKGKFLNHYRTIHNTVWANEVYIEMKDLETQRLAFLHNQNPSFKGFFTWKINQFLKVFSAYGTEPARAVVFSMYVILLFAFIYLLFPNSWDSHGRKRIMNRYAFFFTYMNKKAGIHEVYLDNQKEELLEFDEFKTLVEQQGKTVPKFFTATALPLYKWAVSGTKFSASVLKRVDIMKGTWSELPQSKRIWKSVLLISAFTIAICYDILIKMLNALMLSINTFTTLGFGEIPIKGLPRYLAIIQGFIGWFMLTIFSVSLISQLLN
tara:strand:- start:328 stop:2046 length:1719 start_codon:yes stop_codon:yes gene_type:complete